MRRGLFGLLAVCAATFSLAQSPVIRATLTPTKEIIVGQAVHLNVTVLVPNYFTGSPDFPVFELENAIVVQPQDRPQNLSETIDGVHYAGISQSYTIYPQQVGEFRLPPAQFTIPYAANPPKTTEAHLSLPPLIFHANIPAAAQGLSYFLPTTALTLQQRWEPSLKNIRVGDTLHRTITITTVKTQGMMIPPLSFEASDGVRVYPEQPTVVDQKTPTGEFVYGRRTESARYFLRSAGEYTLPPIQLQWWNLNAHKLVTTSLPSVHLTVAANPGYVEELPPEQEPVAVAQPPSVSFWHLYRTQILIDVPSFVFALLVFWLMRRYVPMLRRLLKQLIEIRRNSERTFFRRLILACKRNDAQGAYRSLIGWIARGKDGTTLQEYLRRSKDDELIVAVEELGASLYSSGYKQSWDGSRLSRLLRNHRHDREKEVGSRRVLPQLNP
ncbi:BatD family protein [Tunturiibacter lichenicola]|uniref:BatD family protein n=1 Tax=Tunturiibacter lichenicola TaxID=2051959 RepID=UPI0021B40B9F|nr:BatD family protein [Edaphobacter lichenicola]